MEAGIQEQYHALAADLGGDLCDADTVGAFGHWYALYLGEGAAGELYAAAAALAPADHRWPYYAGLSAAALGNHSSALSYFQRAASLGSSDAALVRRQGEALIALGQEERARGLLAPLAEAGDARAMLALADLAARGGQRDTAIAWLDRILVVQPAAGEALQRRAQLSGETRSVADRKRELAPVRAPDPLLRARQRMDVSSDMMRRKGLSALQVGDRTTAEYWLRQAVVAAPERREHHENLARLLESGGE